MRALNRLGNIGLREHGIELRTIPFTTFVPPKATMADLIVAGKSILSADWTVCLDAQKNGAMSRFREPDTTTPRLVISIGFQAHGREQLVRDAQLWFETWPAVARAVLVTVVEEPQFSFPIPLDALEHADLPPLAALWDTLYPDGDLGDLQPVSGPIYFAGHRWTGKFAHVWSETWMRHDTPSGPRPVSEDGGRLVSSNRDLCSAL
jgi:hypothetical protein